MRHMPKPSGETCKPLRPKGTLPVNMVMSLFYSFVNQSVQQTHLECACFCFLVSHDLPEAPL